MGNDFRLNPPERLPAARKLLDRGFYLFPLHSAERTADGTYRCTCGDPLCAHPAKHPRKGSNGHLGATRDPKKIEEYFAQDKPSANIGIATGVRSELVVIDIDPRNGGDATFLNLNEEAYEPNTMTVETGGGGLHYYCRYNSAMPKELGDGVDVKTDGGYVLGPTSLHISGKTYEVVEGTDELPLAHVPKHLTRKREKKEDKKKQESKYTLQEVEEMLSFVPADDRSDWIKVGIVLGREFDCSPEAWDAYVKWSEKYDGKKARDHDKQMRDAFNNMSQRPGDATLGSIVKVARANGWRPKPGVLVHVGVGDLLDVLPDPVSFVVKPLLPRGVVTLLSGHGGMGKSILAATIAGHVAGGRDFAALPTMAEPVLIVTLEDDAKFVKARLRRIVRAFDLDGRRVIENTAIIDGTATDSALATEAAEFGVRRLVAAPAYDDLCHAAKGRRLIVIDGASDAYDGDENSRRQVRSFIRMLAAVARENDAAVLLLTHIDKNAARFGASGNSYSGSTAWHNSVRSRLALTNTEGGVELTQEKANLGPKSEPLSFQWSEDGVLLPAGRRSANEVADDDCRTVLDAIRAANRANVDVPAARSGISTALQALRTLPELPKQLRVTSGKDRVWAAITALERSGLIEKVQFKGAGGHTRERYRARESPGPPREEPAQLAQHGIHAAGGASSCSTGGTSATRAKEWF